MGSCQPTVVAEEAIAEIVPVESSPGTPPGIVASSRSRAAPGCPDCSPTGFDPSAPVDELVRCGACNRVFVSPRPRRDGVYRTAVPRPGRFGEQCDEQGLEVRWAWCPWGRALWVLTAAVVWNVAVGVGLLPRVLGVGGYAAAWMVGLLAPVLAVGPVLAWFALAALLDRTVVRVEIDALRIHNGPIPVPGTRRIARVDLEQLFVQRLGGDPGSDANGSPRTVRLMALGRDGRRHELISGLRDVEALWLEERLERCMRIEDRPLGVLGETR